MKIGVVYPHNSIELDFGATREYGQAVEAMGYEHIHAYDHVLGANTASRPNWKGPYKLESTFHEPFVLFSFLAGVTQKVGFIPGVIILPQRQTVLVAKQAACLDVLSNGRLRLGIGIGWNDVEYEGLGMNFNDRSGRYEEQIGVLRELWTKPAVTIRTDRHSITDAGINPLPLQRPIPIWMGGGYESPLIKVKATEKVLRRIARFADGWLPLWLPHGRGLELLEQMRGYAREYGRDPSAIGLEGLVSAERGHEAQWAEHVQAWRDIGATHLKIGTMVDNLFGVEQHLRRLEEFKRALGAG